MSSGGDQTIGYWYYLLLHFGLTRALDGLTEITGGGRTAWAGNATTSQRITINAVDLWGGEDAEGGIQGDVDIMLGEPTQPPNDYLITEQGPLQPAYRGKVSVVFRGGKMGAFNPYPKPIGFRGYRRTADWDGGVWYPEKVGIDLAGGSIRAMNPAHILYESITNSQWGQGEPRGLVDDASFRAAADTLAAEGFGLCTTYETGDIEDFQARIVNVIGAALSQSRTTGHYHLDLIRDDYVLADLPIITEDDVAEVEIEPSQPHEAINQILVEWYDPDTRQKRTTAPVQALGSIRTLGTVISETHNYREIPTEDLALRVAQRDKLARSAPRARFKLVLNRRHFDLRPGQPVRLQMPSEGYADVVLRAGEIQYGRLTDGRMRLTAVEDVFAMPATVYVQPEPGLYVPPDPTPQPSPNQLALEAPYAQLAAELRPADLAALDASTGYLATLATRPGGLAQNYTIATAAVGEQYKERGTGDWCPSALVVEAADKTMTAFTFSGGIDLDLVLVGTAALWGDEIVRVDALDTVIGTLTLGRGCADTVPADHPAGERIWFTGGNTGSDRREYLDGETVRAKLLTRNGAAKLDLGLATELSVVMDQRAARPYPPAQLQINGQSAPTAITAGGLIASWVHRDRVTQQDQLVDATEAGIGPEPGTTYNVRWESPPGTLSVEQPGVVGNTSPTAKLATGTVRVTVAAERDGLPSWTLLEHTFAFTRESQGAPDWADVSVLLHFDGSDSSQVFVDQKGTTWSASGAAALDTAESRFGTAGLQLNGSGHIEATSPAGFDFGTGDFTIEGWVYLESSAATTWLVGATGWTFSPRHTAAGGAIRWFDYSGSSGHNGTTVPALGQWHHVAVDRFNGVLRGYLNGVTEFSVSHNQNYSSPSRACIGATPDHSQTSAACHIDEVRVVKGVALYAGHFTPPAAPFPDA